MGDPSWTILNFTAIAGTNIPSGDMSQPLHSRMLFSFSTFNELKKSYPKDLSGMMPANTDRMEVSCNGIQNGNVKPFLPAGFSHIRCMSILASGDTFNNTPSYIMVNYYS